MGEMRIAIAGAGSVGRSIAKELAGSGHDVLLIDRDTRAIGVDDLPEVEWLLADACELATLEDARLGDFDVVVAASSDDKVNLVVSLLAKTEFGVGRVIARINEPDNEWLFNETWGVDLAVSPPRLIADLVEGAPEDDPDEEGTLPPLPGAEIAESVLRAASPFAGAAESELSAALPEGVALVAVLGPGGVRPPDPGRNLSVGDTVVFLADPEALGPLEVLLGPVDDAADA
ncbi:MULTISPECIES: potassium channel family protein [Nocardiopsidaceae]|uniref:Trk system potassium uptake protein TrkA n=1 Tax=Streptomonospora nanhaiensis TaxID=1323731 RepID=A0ABY6YST7_9ACTN|nr:TrkA family potassium uptake protein [Streptomonospora nanhaiensis]WAE75369.1 TrkA family potassium uptake protein [Streptomonospora nanhaiensis]